MKKRLLSVPQLAFVVGTRALFGAGVALLAGRRLSSRARLGTGIALTVLGAASTIPAVRLLKRSSWPNLLQRFA